MKITDSSHRLRELLRITGDTQNDMSIKTKIPKSSISHYINGEREPRQEKLSMIADAYHVNPAWLMGIDVPMQTVNDLEHELLDTRLNGFMIDINDGEKVLENERKFWLLHEDYEKVKTAMELYKLYESATPEARALIDSFLKSSQQES